MSDLTYDLVVLTNGRDDCLVRTIAAFEEYVDPRPNRRLIFDDTGSGQHVVELTTRFPGYDVRGRPPGESGYAPAMRRAMRTAGRLEGWVFVLEDDFLVLRPVELAQLAAVMVADPRLAQVVLRRQAWFPAEIRAGGMIGRFEPSRFRDRAGYLEHEVFWSMNPHLARAATYRDNPWPLGPGSEERFGNRLFGQRRTVALWGARDEEPWVEHIGAKRVGAGY